MTFRSLTKSLKITPPRCIARNLHVKNQINLHEDFTLGLLVYATTLEAQKLRKHENPPPSMRIYQAKLSLCLFTLLHNKTNICLHCILRVDIFSICDKIPSARICMHTNYVGKHSRYALISIHVIQLTPLTYYPTYRDFITLL